MASDRYNYMVRVRRDLTVEFELCDDKDCFDYLSLKRLYFNETKKYKRLRWIDDFYAPRVVYLYDTAQKILEAIKGRKLPIKYLGGWCPSGSYWGPDDVRHHNVYDDD